MKGSGRGGTVRRSAADLERAEEALRAADATLSAVQSELVDRLGEGDPRALLEERTRELADASAAVERTNAAAADARAALERARRVGENGRDGLSTLANRIVSVWGMLGQARGVATETTAVRSAFVRGG